MKNLAKSLTILACCGSFFAACGGDDAAPAAVPAGGTGGTGGTTAAAGGGTGGTAPTGGTGGTVAGGAGGTAGGTGGTAGSGGTGGAPPPPPPFCDGQTPKTLPFKLITNAAYVPSGWFPDDQDMTAIPGNCTNDPITLPVFDAGVVDAGAGNDDAGAGDAGSADAGGGSDVDAGGPPPEFTTCLGITYHKVSASTFAGINWVPNNGGANSCFEDVGAVEFWAAGTPGAHVNFEAHGTVLEVVLTEEWHKYSIAIAADLNSAGVPIAFTVGFDSTKQADPDAPFTVFYADPTYVAN